MMKNKTEFKLKLILGWLILFAGVSLLYAPMQPEVVLASYKGSVKLKGAASSFSLSQSTPTKIFTPNGDGTNDTFQLIFENPSGSILSQKKIYDLTGAEVADFQVNGDETSTPVTLIWNGRNQSGSIVRSGVYIYQVQAEGKVINGTVVVAR